MPRGANYSYSDGLPRSLALCDGNQREQRESMSSSSTSVQTAVPVKRGIEFDLSQMGSWREYAVVLSNDEVHSMDEVVSQLMKALGCDAGRAQTLMFQAHSSGRTTVAIADRDRAMRIARVLRQISLQVVVRQIN
jgi:ATP-dependent Clp protease adaptor protein ClpS